MPKSHKNKIGQLNVLVDLQLPANPKFTKLPLN